MISEKMTKQLNKQINEELFSSYLYLSMSAYFADESLDGFAHWMMKQSQEEYEHGMKIFGYLTDIGAKVELDKIDKPELKWKSAEDAFKAALKHEIHITDCINKLTDLAYEEKDHATRGFLAWFVQEQVEEVSSATAIVDKFKMVGENKTALYMLDRELGSRA
ncbi:MAG: ferritin [Melioribacteraceae bacterium]|nr:MAG: ferritin [Melioribacteraceae bacterium]